MKIRDVVTCIENQAPLLYQESYDNAGLLTGNYNDEVNSALVSLDVTEAVIDEAIQKEIKLIIAHHPLVFGGLKRFTGRTWVERCLIKAIKNNIAIYCAHTNLDSSPYSHNYILASKLGLNNIKTLIPVKGKLFKLVVFVPEAAADEVRMAIFNAGSGHIGNYDSCSYNISGVGTFRALEGANPYVGSMGKFHKEAEIRIETIVPEHILQKVINDMVQAHPYEEVAYDVYRLENENPLYGTGIIGELECPVSEIDFLQQIKETCKVKAIRHTTLLGRKVNRVALCGGSGASFMQAAMDQKADFYITGDVKYHQFFDVDDKMVMADIGHYESEQFAKDWFVHLLTKKITNFAVHFTTVDTNPVNIF
jgi:dinuclear metal center YbgI/SA1388 family protein